MTGVSQQSQLIAVYDIQRNKWESFSATGGKTPITARVSVGTAADPVTKRIIFYGGSLSTQVNSTTPPTFSASQELDTLDTSLPLNQWTWATVNSPAQPLPGLVRPIMIYVPKLKYTLVMGGCDIALDGTVRSCHPFTEGYMIDTQKSNSIGSPPYIEKKTLYGIQPAARYAPCVALLDDGTVFMYGGATSTGSFDDSWKLDVETGNWTRLEVTGVRDDGGRAGATCQRVTSDQIIMVGGFTGGYLRPNGFSSKQVVIINTKKGEWSTSFTADENNKDSDDELSMGAVIGIAAAACIVTGLVGLFIGNFCWRRRSQKKRDQSLDGYRANPSNELLVDGDELSTNNTGALHVMDTGKNVSNISSCGSSKSHIINMEQQTSPKLPKEKERPGFIIIPYTPNVSTEDYRQYSDTHTTDSIEMTTVYNSKNNNSSSSNSSTTTKNSRPNDSRKLQMESSLPKIIKGSQLPHDLADNQQSMYHKILQHQKHYNNKKQREYESGMVMRMGTQDSFMNNVNNNNCKEEEGSELSTGVIALADIDVGEEPVRYTYNAVEDGMFLLTSPLESSPVDYSQRDRRSIIRY
ncbi:hypothetical protein BGZ76_010331 [Entomortierella beljakovae]|nr:hypothetical protein BGZ76_010331 [Entomortierella beljakovae]